MIARGAYLAATSAFLRTALSKQPPYFPLSFRPRSIFSRDRSAVSLNQVVKRHKICSIIGGPGAGKSRAILDLASVFCAGALDKGERTHDAELDIPVYVPMRHCAPLDARPLGSLEEVILRPLNYGIQPYGCSFGSPRELSGFLRNCQSIIFLDGLNELAGPEIGNLLGLLKESRINGKIVVASRIREYPTERIDYPVYEVDRLAFPQDVRAFIARITPYYGLSDPAQADVLRACENNMAIRGLATNPYFLCQLCLAVQLGIRPFPADKVSLLAAISERMIASQGVLDVSKTQSALCCLAYNMHRRRVLTIEVGDAVGLLNQSGYSQAVIDSMTQLRLLVRRSADNTDWVGWPRDSLEFVHQVFQEFYAGIYIHDMIDDRRNGGTFVCREKMLWRTVISHSRSLWDWEILSIAIARLSHSRARRALAVLKRTARRNVHLAALMASELPPLRDREDADVVRRLFASILRRLQGQVIRWSFWVPHSYKWIPTSIIASLLYGVYRILSHLGAVDELHAISDTTPAFALGLGLALFAVTTGLCGCCVYYGLLRLTYSHLDELVFDKKVRKAITSLELLRDYGGGQILLAMQSRAAEDPFMGDRMRSWLQSSQSIGIEMIPDALFALPRPRRIKAIRQLLGIVNPDRIALLLGLLKDGRSGEPERKVIFGLLDGVLAQLDAGDPLLATITVALQEHLHAETSPEIICQIRRILAQPRRGGGSLLDFLKAKWKFILVRIVLLAVMIGLVVGAPSIVDSRLAQRLIEASGVVGGLVTILDFLLRGIRK